MKELDPLSEDNVFEDYYDVIYRAQYDEDVQIKDPEGFMEWAARKVESAQEEFGMSPPAFFLFVLQLLRKKGIPYYTFLDEIKSKRILLLGVAELAKHDPELLEDLLKKNLTILSIFKKLPSDMRKPFKDTLSIVARTEIGEMQYQALEALSDLIYEDPDLMEFFYSLLHDWDDKVRHIVLKALAKQPNEETKRRVKAIKYDENNENNLKLIEYILSYDG
ncbi:MAG: hypothetical protein GXN92_02005 [Candidatus Micrarchaeota archaeon]|nr:hypothetical protein [Candidatus Micrarchaeota archaeon]